MKTVLIFSLIIAGFTAVFAQKLPSGNVPAPVRSSFVKQYPGTTARWEKEGDQFEANFKHQGHVMSALFTSNGTLTETETDIKIAELPSSVLSYLKEHYKGAKLKEAAKITKAGGEVNYEAEVNGKDVIFDANGKFLRVQKD